jgi:hypothetical protein
MIGWISFFGLIGLLWGLYMFFHTGPVLYRAAWVMLVYGLTFIALTFLSYQHCSYQYYYCSDHIKYAVVGCVLLLAVIPAVIIQNRNMDNQQKQWWITN